MNNRTPYPALTLDYIRDGYIDISSYHMMIEHELGHDPPLRCPTASLSVRYASVGLIYYLT